MSYIAAQRSRDHILVWERVDANTRVTKKYPGIFEFYSAHPDGEYKSIYSENLKKHKFDTFNECKEARNYAINDKRIKLYESDIEPIFKVLSKHYYGKSTPTINTTFWDIEVDYHSHSFSDEVMVNVRFNSDEQTLRLGYVRALPDKERKKYEIYEIKLKKWVPYNNSTYVYVGETGFPHPAEAYAPINAISLHHYWCNKSIVLAVPPPGWNLKDFDESLRELTEVIFFKTERQLLERFLTEIENSDALVGWNSETFDNTYTAKRLEKLGLTWLDRLSFPDSVPNHYTKSKTTFRPITKMGKELLLTNFGGRVSLDYLDLFKKYEGGTRSTYKLESVAEECLPLLTKLTYEGTLEQLYRNDFNHFVRYNIRDTEILKGFEDKFGYVALASEMCHSSTGKYSQVYGTVSLADNAIINYCHNTLNVKVPDRWDTADGSIQGAYVLLPQRGMHEWVGSIDLSSLYPSCLLSLNISPETHIGNFVNDIQAWNSVYNRDLDTILTLQYIDHSEEVHTVRDWLVIVEERNWAVSGFGVIFSLDKLGAIPQILAEWYVQRKEYQKIMRDSKSTAYKIKTLCTDEKREMSPIELNEYTLNYEKGEYYDRLQYSKKIQLNSMYGCLTNYDFRFFRLELGESVTACGRMILRHQCRKVAELLDGNYNVDFPLYEPVKDAIDMNCSTDLALHGPKFKGEFQSESIIYGDSVGYDSRVHTIHGEFIIQDLFKSVDNTIGTKEYHHPNDLQVLTYDEVALSSCYKPVKYVMRHKINKQVYRVWISNTNYVDVTEDHSLIGYRNVKDRKPGESNLINVKPTEIGTIASSLIFLKYIPRVNIEDRGYSKELYEVLGFTLGSGYIDPSVAGNINLSVDPQDNAEVLTKLIIPLFQQKWITSYTELPNGHDIIRTGVKLYHVIRSTLYETGNKRIPSFIFSETEEHISAFLRGYFSASGYISKTGKVSLCSIERDNIIGVQQLLLYCGIPSNSLNKTATNLYGNISTGIYQLNIKDDLLYGFKVGFILDRKQKCTITHCDNTKLALDCGFSLTRVACVEKIEYSDYVYDIEVDDTHTFFANNILVHNTDSCYFKTHADNKADAITIADFVAKKVNASFPAFMEFAFLCRNGYQDKMKTAREVVGSRGIFVDKKRYIIHIVDSEGTSVDKTKIMGLELKKTTIPKPIAIKLTDYITRLLRGQDWDDIAKEIVEYKDEIVNTNDILLMGLPKGINGVEAYTEKYQLTGLKTRLPGHVAASIHYNECLVLYEDNDSEQITSGMKIKVYYLTRVFGKFKAIALPTDISIIPQWFTDNYTPIIDREAQLQRLINKPLEHILKAINKDVPSAQLMLVQELMTF